MKFKKIVGFGDSWMWGDELMDPTLHGHPGSADNTCYREKNCFLGLLGQHYGVPTENFGIPGGSLQSSIWTYLWWLQNESLPISDCLILVALTYSGRSSYYNPAHISYKGDPPWNRFVHSSWAQGDSDCYSEKWNTTVKNLFVLSNCQELLQLNFDQTVYFFEGQSSSNGGNILQFKSHSNETTNRAVKSLIWPDQTLERTIRQNPEFQQMLAPRAHPNEQGHRLISQNLINYVDSCII